MNTKKFLLFMTIMSTASVMIIYYKWNSIKDWKYVQTIISTPELGDNLHLLLKIEQHLAKAHRYARSGKTIVELQAAHKIIQSITKTKIDTLKRPYIAENSTNSIEKSEICPEKYLGEFPSYPLYYNNFISVPCNHHPFNSILSIVILTTNCSQAEVLLSGIQMHYNETEVVLGIVEKSTCDADIQKKYGSNFEKLVIKSDSGLSDSGATWRSLIEKTSKKYVFVGRGMELFDEHSTNLERLVRLIISTDVDVAGGSIRYSSGRWFMGCYQIGIRNYAVKFHEGYDLSHSSCAFCDYLAGPFVAKKELLLKTLNSNMIGEATFVDFFLTLSRQDKLSSVLCPDVMFHITPGDRLNDLKRATWQQVAKKWEVNRVILPNHHKHIFNCEEAGTTCRFNGGETVPPCCLKELNDALIYLITMCDKHGIGIEVFAGTMFGAVKFSGSFPWERDHDTDFLATDYAKLTALKKEFAQHGYKLEGKYLTKYGSDMVKCSNSGTINCAYYAMRTKHWRIELWGSGYLMHNRGREKLARRTLVSVDGVWMPAYDNPAKAVRGEYGDDIFQHIEHWGTLGKSTSHSGYTLIQKGSFLPCKRPNFHGCLSNFLPEGNIQFQDVWI